MTTTRPCKPVPGSSAIHPFGKAICWSLVLLFVAVTGCDRKAGNSNKKGQAIPTVASTNYPIHFFVQRIAGDHINAIFPVVEDGESGDPAYWKPSGNAVAAMQKADKVIVNGAGYESWLPMVTLSESSVVRTSDTFKSNWIKGEPGVAHQHGPEGVAHDHGEVAFTTWLNPEFAIQQARSVCDTMNELRPEHKTDFETGFAALENELRGLRKELAEVAHLIAGKHLLCAHPVYQYLQSLLGFEMHHIQFETDSEPANERWTELDEFLKKHPKPLMLWQVSPSAKLLQEFENRGIKVVVFDPMGNQPSEGDFLSGMKQNIERFREAISQ